jgi:hypothetical protein
MFVPFLVSAFPGSLVVPPSFRTRGLRRAKEGVTSGLSPMYCAQFERLLRGKLASPRQIVHVLTR